MKELSIEEKAKAYDEAIERAKLELNSPDKRLIEYIFPELKESEDERVRNKFIEFFKGYSPDKEWWGNITQEDILAWLEKQGEQKPAETEKETNGNEREIPFIEPPLTIKHAREVMGIKQDDAWSEDDEKMLENTIGLIEVLDMETKGAFITKEYINFLKSLKDRYTWKPSDEQFKVLNEVLNFAANHESPHWNDYIFGTLNNLIRQLKKLMEE